MYDIFIVKISKHFNSLLASTMLARTLIQQSYKISSLKTDKNRQLLTVLTLPNTLLKSADESDD